MLNGTRTHDEVFSYRRGGIGNRRSIVLDAILEVMDHLAVLRQKVRRLRAEIAQLQELNDRYWLRGRNETEAQVAHGERHKRLQAIQQELAQLAGLGPRAQSVEQMKQQRRGRPYLLKKVS